MIDMFEMIAPGPGTNDTLFISFPVTKFCNLVLKLLKLSLFCFPFIQVPAVRSRWRPLQRLASLARHPLLSTHDRPRRLGLPPMLTALLWRLSGPQVPHDSLHITRGQILVVCVRKSLHALCIIGDSNHRRVDTRPHALHLPQRKHPIRRRLPVVHAKLLFQRAVNLLAPLQHAWRGATHHDVVLANLAAVEHGVEGGHFEHADLGHTEHACDLAHRVKRQPAVVLLLGQVQHGDDGRLTPVGRVPRANFLDASPVGFRERKRRLVVVVGLVHVDVQNVVAIRRVTARSGSKGPICI
mmetsp:Transcript_14570/g.41511  ORF Transcript_14570/g.41511 Transcript_14570/m.41511 type:complete len:297 (+) Transcript_14570:941-1831(+)